MNHRHIANLVVSVIRDERNDKVRAIRLFVEKTAGVKVANLTQEELSDALVALLDGPQEDAVDEE